MQIINLLEPILHRLILLLQSSRVSKGYRGKLIVVVKQNTFQRSLAAINEQSPTLRFILWHSKLVQKLSNICTVHQVLLFKEKTEELLMSVSVKSDASTVREEVLFLQIGCQ